MDGGVVYLEKRVYTGMARKCIPHTRPYTPPTPPTPPTRDRPSRYTTPHSAPYVTCPPIAPPNVTQRDENYIALRAVVFYHYYASRYSLFYHLPNNAKRRHTTLRDAI